MTNREQYEMLCEKADKYDKLVEQIPRWVSVDDRLPYQDVHVLVDDGIDMFVAWYDGDDWYSFDDNYNPDNPILAWQPLPEPYYEEGEENNE